MEQQNSYEIDMMTARSLSEDGYCANMKMSDFYERVLKRTEACNMFLQSCWFRDMVNLATDLNSGIEFLSFTQEKEFAETTLKAKFGNIEIIFEIERIVFYDSAGIEILRFSSALLNSATLTSIIKSYESTY